MDYIVVPSPDWEHRKKIELAIKEGLELIKTF